MSNEEWVFKPKTNLIYIQNNLTKKVLGATNDGQVIPEDYEEGKDQQLWKKGEPNNKGYFTLENYRVSKFLTVASSTRLELKGKITLRWILVN